jgi:hypothetical protein
MSRIDRINRALLFAFGLVVLAAGVYALIRSYGGLGEARTHAVVLTPVLRRFVGSNLGWFWLAVLGVAVLLAFAGLWLLRMQLSTRPALGEVLLGSDRQGRSVLDAGALEAAVAEDIASYEGVMGARSKLRADGMEPDIVLRVEVADDADITAVRQRIEAHALRRLREALEVSAVRADLTLDLSAGRRELR